MKAITRIGLALSLGSVCLFAETWSGKLIDASCEARQTDKSKIGSECTPTATTTSFAIQTEDGKVFKLDSSGNSRATAAIKKDETKNSATVSGTLDGQTVKVQSLDIR